MDRETERWKRVAHFLWELLDRIAEEDNAALAERRHEEAQLVNGVLRWTRDVDSRLRPQRRARPTGGQDG